MNAIVKTMAASVPAADDYPRPNKIDELGNNLDHMAHVAQKIETAIKASWLNLANLHELVLDATWLGEDWAESVEALVRQARRRATKADIAFHLVKLVAAFPNAGKVDPAYMKVLCERVGEREPTIGNLEAACRHLQETAKFLPVVSEVLTAITEAEKRLSAAGRNADVIRLCLPDLKAQHAKALGERRDHLESMRAKLAEEEAKGCRPPWLVHDIEETEASIRAGTPTEGE